MTGRPDRPGHRPSERPWLDDVGDLPTCQRPMRLMGQMLPSMSGELHEQHRAVHRSSPHLGRAEDVTVPMRLQRRRMQMAPRSWHASGEGASRDDDVHRSGCTPRSRRAWGQRRRAFGRSGIHEEWPLTSAQEDPETYMTQNKRQQESRGQSMGHPLREPLSLCHHRLTSR